MSIVVYNEVETPIVPVEGLAGRVREALGGSLRSMRYVTPDFAGLYQDAAGTTPVTAVGQPVGLMLDRRFGLSRGDKFALDFREFSKFGGWEAVGSDAIKATLPPSSGEIYTSLGQILEGAFIEVEFDVAGRTAGSGFTRIGTTSPSSGYSTNGHYRAILQRALGANQLFTFYKNSAFDGEVVNISIRELPGNHASQATTTARPTLRSGPLRIDYDGVDDYLRTVFPDLGSDVTIARSIPGVGAQILTGQTIAAGNWDDNVTSCATLVIDRALTGPETALVTAFLNQQAGV